MAAAQGTPRSGLMVVSIVTIYSIPQNGNWELHTFCYGSGPKSNDVCLENESESMLTNT